VETESNLDEEVANKCLVCKFTQTSNAENVSVANKAPATISVARLPIPTANAALRKLKSAIWPIFNTQKVLKEFLPIWNS